MRANTVGRRAFWIILSISLCFITLSVTVFSLFEYRRRSAVIEREIATLRDAEMAGITKGLWDYDSDILYALIEGFSFYPYIRYVEIRDLGTYTISRGTDEPDNPGETFPLVRKMPGGSEEMIGFLLIKVDRDKILSDVTGQVLMSLFLQVIFLIFELFIIILILVA